MNTMEQPANMMPNAGINNTMQRPQRGNVSQQIYAKLVSDLTQRQAQLPQGWQRTFDIKQRAARLMELVSGLSILNPGDYFKCIAIAENFENKTIHESPNREVWEQKIKRKNEEIQAKRAAAASGTFPGAPMAMQQQNMGAMNNMQNSGMGGMQFPTNMGMNMDMNMNMLNGQMGMPNGPMGDAGGQQNMNFPAHLQRPMQPSGFPTDPQNNTLDPSALQQPQMPSQMPKMNQPNQMPQMNMNQGGQPQQAGQPTQQQIQERAMALYRAISEDKKTALRTQLLNGMPEQQRAQLASQKADPLVRIMFQKAKEQLMRMRAGQTGQLQQPNMGAAQMGNNMSMQLDNAGQLPPNQPGAANFDFTSLIDQRANAIKLQESGETVVPASNNTTNNNNNNMGMGGQMNMPQNVNPQMLSNNQNNQANQQQLAAMQFAAMQREKNRTDQMKNQLAQQQAFAQQQAAQNQLRGQPGGLNAPNALNGGQVNSPAMDMSMLTRPMVPPGQSTPSTPLQNRPQGMPQAGANGANQLVQHHQQMVNQNAQPQNLQGMNLQGELSAAQQQQVLASLPPHLRQRLTTMGQDQVNSALKAFALKGLMNNQQRQAGMPPNMMNMGQMQPGNQQGTANGMPPNVGTAVPGFNVQPPANQQQQQQQQQQQPGPQTLNNQFQERMAATQQNQTRQQAMNIRKFPRQILPNLGITVPDHIDTWGKLKQHVLNSQASMPPNTMGKIQALQNQYFVQRPEELQMALQALKQALQSGSGFPGQQRPMGPPPASMAMPNGQAPPAQMVPPAAPMQQPPKQNVGQTPNMNRMPPFRPAPATPQEIQMHRAQVPGAQNMSDDQIRNAIMQRKIEQHTNAMQELQNQQNIRNMQLAQNQLQGGQNGNGNQQPPQRPGQQGPPNNQQPNGQGQGQKRPSSDDVMEIPNPNAPQNAPQPPNQPTQQPPKPKAGPGRRPTQEDIDKLPPAQKALLMHKLQLESVRRAQANINQNAAAGPQPQGARPQPSTNGPSPLGMTAQDYQKLMALKDSVQKTPKGPEVRLDAAGIERAKEALKKLWPAVQTLDRTFTMAWRLPTFGEAKVREILEAKAVIEHNVADANGNIKDYLSVRPEKLKEYEFVIGNYFKQMKAARDAIQAGNVPGMGQGQAQPPSGNGVQVQAQQQKQQQQPKQPPAPATNGKTTPGQQAPGMDRKQSQQAHARKASNTKAPPAPTDNKTFDWVSAQSPQAIPKYDSSRTELTADKLKFPPAKKRKTGQQGSDSQASTPAQQTGTPGTSAGSPAVTGPKVPSPEQARKAMDARREQDAQKPRFVCQDATCDESIKGFGTEEMLKLHVDTVHKPIEDPLSFALESAAKALGVDKDGKPLVMKQEAKVPSGARATAKAGVVKRESQTPSSKPDGASMGTPSSTGKVAGKAPVPAGKKGVDVKAAESKPKVPEKEKTLQESLAEKMGFLAPSSEPKQPETPAFELSAEDDIWLDTLQANLTSGAPDSDLRTHFDFNWSLHPEQLGISAAPIDSSPELTPGDSMSSGASDISMNARLVMNLGWDPWDNGDTGVPEEMKALRLASPLSGEGKGGDGAAKEQDRGVSGAELMDWEEPDFSWEALFGPNAGLGDGGMDFQMEL